ncbi:galactokinase [Clostridium cochlearium]|uniref:Galactokinase n=1 Tax=Clostridium cochlearium TaxID=1494 RepID=A0A1G9F668_CLOCO|nr:galactokinase [Clostridium cochlearium]MBV1820770.1 galactokinase [Bacteroidales bacterium MSK.15.36]NSJ90292.1 galactokinase [Coprococcus sp. MSK.21.13]MBU5269666.1 galactokinase [Clostridium cochlearium]MCG4571227.1 galactokinase [Clostridium cochlearium]MCG4578756.1 galactokinase [Clostridium cochlearium]
MDIKKLKEKFIKLYGEGYMRTFFSPGRVNLIGEHIDYNGGNVFPCALNFGTLGCVRKRKDKKVNLASTNIPLKISIDLDNIKYKKEDGWGNYPKGVIKEIIDKGYKVGGMDILVSGNIPNGAGLSSSASLELLIAIMINNIFNNGKLDKIELIKLSQKAENDFVGLNCGIMDQFAVAMGKKDRAILLDCNTLEYKYAPVNLKNYVITIMNTNKRRELSDSKYNERRLECEKALKIINNKKKINYLCELSLEEFEGLKNLIEDKIILNRATHVVYENERVKRAYDLLLKGNIDEFGKLLIESHFSLRNLYEVTGKELDVIVDEALKVPGCIGARMTGAGFGGCAIALVEKNKLDLFKEEVSNNYNNIIGYKPDFYTSEIGEGTYEI